MNIDALHASSAAAPPGLHSERRSQLAAGAGAACLTVHRVLAAYAALLAAGAAMLFVLDEGMLLIQMSNAAAFGSAACSLAANVGTGAPPVKGSPTYTRWMVGVHVGMVLPLVYGVSVGALAAKCLGQTGPNASFTVYATLTAVSSVALALIFLLRPRKASAGSSLV